MNIGVLGTGKIARHHAAAVRALGHKITAASARSETSPNWQAFRKSAPEAAFVSHGSAMLNDPSLDAIIVCLPWDATGEWLNDLLACRKPMLIEKPVALDSARVRAALGRHAATSRNKLAGYNRRYYRTVDTLRQRLAEGGLKSVQATISEDIVRHVTGHGIRIIPHVLAFSSSHTLDLLLHLLGPLTVVHASKHRERGDAAPFVSFNGVLQTAAGIPVFLALNAGDPSPAGLRFLFDDRTTWALAPLETLTRYDRYEIEPERPGSSIRRYVPHAAMTMDEDAAVKPGFIAQMQAFLSGEFGPGARAQDSVRVLELIETIQGTA